MIQFRIADGCGPTGRLLQKLVGEMPGDAVVCWGAGYQGPLPALNARCGRANKLQQLEVFAASQLPTLQFWMRPPTDPAEYPILSRAFQHHGGRDIGLILQPVDAPLFKGDFYTRYIPRETEYRVWMYRRRHLGSYEKRLVHPGRYRKVGANWGNGFAFQLMNSGDVPRDAVDIAARAVDSLGMDFGAADILRGADGRLYLLEVNSAPGVEGENRQVIQALAEKIQRWAHLKFPRRKGDKQE